MLLLKYWGGVGEDLWANLMSSHQQELLLDALRRYFNTAVFTVRPEHGKIIV